MPDIPVNKTMTENEIRQKNKNGTLPWVYTSTYKTLSEDFIREFKNEVNWLYISMKQNLSEEFIIEFKDKVNWLYISKYQKLSENFIREFKDKVDWNYISAFQNLTENFIREFKDKVDWNLISVLQNLSEDFIREFKDKVSLADIFEYQNLSEDFIREFKDKVSLESISTNQILSEEFRKEFNIIVPANSWLYKSDEEKLELVKNTGLYEIEDNYVIAYKSVRSDFSSVFKRGIYYHVGSIVSAHCNCNSDGESSFGLSAWTKEGALRYYDKGLLLKVRIPINKLGCLVHDSHKIRCFELEVMEVVEK